MKNALIVGIDHYDSAPLNGCVNDAMAMDKVLSVNHDGSPNFSTLRLTSGNEPITRSFLRSRLQLLFSSSTDLALFYFSGHGYLNDLGGYLVTQDAETFDEGVSMTDVLAMANKASCKEIVIILDCCHSGAFGSNPIVEEDTSILRMGLSVLCASRRSEAAIESFGSGLFTSLVCEGLYGGAAGLLGTVTSADLYGFVNQTIGPWGQRPLFKCHVSGLTPLRVCNPQIDVSVLRQIVEIFPTPDHEFPLDPSYETGEISSSDGSREAIYDIIRRYRAAGLVAPARGVFHGSLLSGSCQLSKLGRYYWNVVQAKKV